MKTPITKNEIQSGDLIRWESPDGNEAHEARIIDPNTTGWAQGQHYLLDRRASHVDLPAEATLGWATTRTGSHLGTWALRDGWLDEDGPRAQRVEEVTGFTAAVAVPAEALDALREFPDSFLCDGHPETVYAVGRISAFLAAIDEANT